jgi:p21-activated kinase 1
MDSYLVDTNIWLVMEYLDGTNLSDALPPCGLNNSEITAVFYNVLKALEYIHSKQVIHKDIKVDNILLSKQGEVKLADFGLSKKISNKMVDGYSTPFIMAPELARQGTYDNKVDIWALGIMLYWCFYGVPPYYDEEDDDKTIELILKNGTPPIPNTQRATMMNVNNTYLANFLDQCLMVNPDDRPSATELLNHILLFNCDNVNSKSTVTRLVKRARQSDIDNKSRTVCGCFPRW